MARKLTHPQEALYVWGHLRLGWEIEIGGGGGNISSSEATISFMTMTEAILTIFFLQGLTLLVLKIIKNLTIFSVLHSVLKSHP